MIFGPDLAVDMAGISKDQQERVVFSY